MAVRLLFSNVNFNLVAGVASLIHVWFFGLTSVRAEVSAVSSLVDNPGFYKTDPQETVIRDIDAWSHPTKQVFRKSHLTLTKVELMWNRKFPVFHITDFGADPEAGPTGSFFTPLELDLLEANGNNPLKIVEDNSHNGFVVAYDRRKHELQRELVQGERP